MKNNYLTALCVALIFISCSKTEDPLIPTVNEKSESAILNKKSGKEIKGTLTYNYTEAFDLSCSTCGSGSFSGGNYYGSGNLSHLGKITSKTKACIALIMAGGNLAGVHIDNQCCSFVAPNGDELYLTNDPYDLYMNSSGIAVGTCQFYFAGGTGKYKDAKGYFKGSVKNDLMKRTFTVDISGTLDY